MEPDVVAVIVAALEACAPHAEAADHMPSAWRDAGRLEPGELDPRERGSLWKRRMLSAR